MTRRDFIKNSTVSAIAFGAVSSSLFSTARVRVPGPKTLTIPYLAKDAHNGPLDPHGTSRNRDSSGTDLFNACQSAGKR